VKFKTATDCAGRHGRVKPSRPARAFLAPTAVPITSSPKPTRGIWRIWLISDFVDSEFRRAGIVNGWGGSVGGGSATDHDGMLYSATDEDKAAVDWSILISL
jgi:hypothetical protein